MRHLLLASTLVLLAGCNPGSDGSAVPDPQAAAHAVEFWRLEIQLPDTVLPVRLHLASDFGSAWLENGPERVTIADIGRDGSHLRLHFPAFNNTFELMLEDQSLSGTLTLVKLGYQQIMPVSGRRGLDYRFSPAPSPDMDVTGRWETLFTADDHTETRAVAEFEQQGSHVLGTFMTPLGDYRYLEGEVDGRRLRLSTFDGSHAFVFVADMDVGGGLNGDFWSGTRWHERWVARRNFDARLPDPYALTFLKEGYETLEFTFPDLEGKPVSLGDAKYRGRVVLVTLSGTWCPNCADETAFLSEYFRRNHQRGLEIITLLYEHYGDFERAAAQGRALREEYGIDYDLLVAGTSDKARASETLPMLNSVLAFPTMIFIDRSGRVRRIHTGFSGPGTGAGYSRFVAEFEHTMSGLLGETRGSEQ